MSMKTNVDVQVHVWAEEDMTAPVESAWSGGQGDGFRVAVQSCRKPEKVEPNDDSALLYAWPCGTCVMAVADGVGGAPLGNQASFIAMRTLREQLDLADPTSDLRPFIMDAIERANAEILDCQLGSATTLTVVEIRDHEARVYQVGDSMAVVFGGRGLVKFRSVCHSPVGYAVESGFMDDGEAMHHEERHYVSNLVGSREMRIEVGPAIALAARDAVLIASDGLFDNLSLDEVIAGCLRGPATRRVAGLVDQARSRMNGESFDEPCKPDDLTVMLWLPSRSVSPAGLIASDV